MRDSIKKVLPLAVTLTGTVLAVTFGIASISTGMWGCGETCGLFVTLFWVSCVLASVGGILMLMNRKRSVGVR